MNNDNLLFETHYKFLISFLKAFKEAQESDNVEKFVEEYLTDYEPEYKISLSHGYESVNVNLAIGGPSHWIDTSQTYHEFNTAWASSPVSNNLPECLANFLDNYYADILFLQFGISAENIGNIDYDAEDVQKSIDFYEESLKRLTYDLVAE